MLAKHLRHPVAHSPLAVSLFNLRGAQAMTSAELGRRPRRLIRLPTTSARFALRRLPTTTAFRTHLAQRPCARFGAWEREVWIANLTADPPSPDARRNRRSRMLSPFRLQGQ